MALIKFGWILLREGLIQRNQMENILNIQRKKQDRLFGELASHYFSVPEEEIEAAFANHVLTPFLKTWFFEELGKKVKVKGMRYEEFVPGVDITLTGFTRKIVRSSFYENNKGHYTLGSGSVELQIKGGADLTIHTVVNEPVVFAEVQFELNMATLAMTLLNPHLFTEAKLRLLQLFKKQDSTT
ncbi:MAG: hypothetical protein HY885_17070 [Deltaproteobacteria bacterium]|nr:hypothetical protein [Deltaproteobacteria bacterium]